VNRGLDAVNQDEFVGAQAISTLLAVARSAGCASEQLFDAAAFAIGRSACAAFADGHRDS
jgi:hypothetical protein